MTRPIQKVLMVTDAFHPESGGVERACGELAAALVSKGVRVSVLARAVKGRPSREEIDGIAIHRYPWARKPTAAVYLSHFLFGLREFSRIKKNDPPDLVHAHLSLSSQGPLFALRRSPIPLVASFHGPWHKEFSIEAEDLFQTRGALYGRYLNAQMDVQKTLQKRTLRLARRIVFHSEFSRGQILEMAPWAEPKLTKIPGGVNTRTFFPGDGEKAKRKFGLSPDQPTLFTARRLVKRMGIDILLEAMARLEKTGVNAKLLVAGKGPLRKELEGTVVKLGLSGAVRFIGFVPDKDLADLYRACDLFVIPTRGQENFGLPVLEATACGCPVVATPAGSLPEVMALAGSPYVCKKADAESLADTIGRALAESPKGTARQKEAARAVARDLSWEKIAQRHLDHYAKVSDCASS